MLTNLRNPLIILLTILAIVSLIAGDVTGTFIIAVMAVVAVTLRFVQERNADKAADKLKVMVRTTATVLRDGEKREIA